MNRKMLQTFVVVLAMSVLLLAGEGGIKGKITDKLTGDPLVGVNIVLKDTPLGAATNEEGEYRLMDVPEGKYEMTISYLGYKMETVQVEVVTGQTLTMDFVLQPTSLVLGDVVVVGASRVPEKITEAPAAVSVLSAATLQHEGLSGQVPVLLDHMPGIDVAASNMFDVNVNTRGFNSSLNRRVLILMDGREMGIPFLGAMRWDAFSVPLEDLGRLEFVRGPGSALFGANAYSGVINITSTPPAMVAGTKVSVSGGELSMFRGDIRHAGVTGQWSYKINVGRAQTESFARSRTAEVEYEGLSFEKKELDEDKIISTYGSARLDYQVGGNEYVTFEGGATQAENEVFVTGIGRVQVLKELAPWGRVNYSSERLFIQASVTGRSTDEQIALASGALLKEHSSTINVEFQHNTSIDLGKSNLKLIWGGSHRIQNVDTKGTLTLEKIDENYSGLYAQLHLELSEQLKLIGASRFDRSSLYDAEFSPKAGVVFSPTPNHNFRATYNHAFQSGNYSEYFLSVPAGAPVDLTAVGLGVVQILAKGNNNLEVETVDGFEVGYKGIYGKKLFVTIDAYRNNLRNFITDLLPGVNPDYAYTKTPQEEAILNAVAQAVPALKPLIPGFTRINGQPAFVISYTNAGQVNEQGMELGINYFLNNQWLLEANATWFDFEVKSKQVGDVLLPNTPDKKFNVGISYQGPRVHASLKWKHVPSYDWAAGIFVGRIQEYDIVNAAFSYRLNKNLRFTINALNLNNESHYEIFGGSMLKRRIIGNLSVMF